MFGGNILRKSISGSRRTFCFQTRVILLCSTYHSRRLLSAASPASLQFAECIFEFKKTKQRFYPLVDFIFINFVSAAIGTVSSKHIARSFFITLDV